jgi:hypothetical protein
MQDMGGSAVLNFVSIHTETSVQRKINRRERNKTNLEWSQDIWAET